MKSAAKRLDPDQILASIEKGIDDTLGPGSSFLIFKTLKLVYSFDKNEITSDFDRFEELMIKILGPELNEKMRLKVIHRLEENH